MSDHFSGPRALTDPSIDITDLFAFPSPTEPGHLVLVLNVFPNAQPSALFSDAAVYRLRIRPVSLNPSGSSSIFDVGQEEYPLSCTFGVPGVENGGEQPVQRGHCVLPDGSTVSFRVNDERGGHASGVRIFAGLRLDPFFMDVPRDVETRASRQLAFQTVGANTLDGVNCLSVVVDLDVWEVLGAAAGTLFAVAGETVTDGKRPIRLERIGRPEMKNVLMAENGVDSVNRELDVRDLYNQEDPFRLAPSYLGAYRARLNANLAFMDGLDGKLDWPLEKDDVHPLTELLLADFLVVDIAKPYAEDSYFEIERSALRGRAHATSGGRSLNDDVIDALYTLVVNGGNGPRIRDGVDQATVLASRTYPYLAPPNANPPHRDPGVPTTAAR